ncbi:hypothetical protein ACL9RL_00515 [Plantibacter sp. Mn2098]|uniref:hypothetical protein n=1 Tax=Plantibacter sp. Mn2098 TaxID=3395266 RepID=UPI003BDEED65
MTQPTRFATFLKGYGRLTIFMIPIGIALNFVGGQIASLTKLPVYLDSIGTILVGALCGSIPGAIVGLISNLINAITIPTLVPYATLSIIFGLLAGQFSRWGWFRSFWKTVLAAVPLSIVGGWLGALITIWVYGGLGGSGGADLIVAALAATGLSVPVANFIAYVPIDFLDKIVTVIIVYLLLKRLPTRLLTKLPLGSIYLRTGRRPKRTTATATETTAP